MQHVARQRRIVADAGSYDQKIALVAWEHDTFRQRMKFMDQRCGGTGWEDLYARAVANQDRTIAMSIKDESFQNTTTTNSTTSTSPSITWLADTLLLSCLLTSGYADGWIHRTVQPITSLTRGRQGVAAIRRMDTTPAAGTKQRIHSDLLWLPILSREQRRRQQQQKQQSERVVTPSTTLPLQMPEYWLAQDANKLHDPHQLHEIVKHWEEFLYQVIAQERAVDSSRWVLWNAACQPTERQALAATQKLVATTCLEENNKTSANISEPADDEEEECCSFYDPNVKP